MSPRTAARTSAQLSLLFLVVYGGTNGLTSLRTDVGTWYFEWEHLIPFVPLMILPYLSIDILFVIAPFLCHDRRELRTLERRITVAILVAGTCFLVFPLRFAFERPAAVGALASIFGVFRGVDPPFNLFPSLHITLLVILADVYLRHTAGRVRVALGAWLVLVGLSTILTYQHHLVDVGGGLLLAVGCFYAVQDRAWRQPGLVNYRVGAYYAVACLAALILSAVMWPWGVALLWPAVAMGIVATAYFGLGPGIFHKTNGRLPCTTRLVLAPCLLGQYLSLLYYRRQCGAWDPVATRVLIGRRLTNREAAEAVRGGVTAVVDLTAEFSEAKPFLQVAYRNMPILDLTAPTPAQLRDIVQFIQTHTATGTVYIHCKAGYSRSAAAIGAYLMVTRSALGSGEVEAILRAARPSIVVRPETSAALRLFEGSAP